MAVKRKRRSHKHYTGREGGDIVELAARLAPLEEHQAKAAQHSSKDDDTIILDTGKLKLPSALSEKEEDAHRIFGLEPVVLVILLLTLAFIALMAYLVYLMPAPG